MISPIVGRGYGSFGSLNLVVTRGFRMGTVVFVDTPNIWHEPARDTRWAERRSRTWTEESRDRRWSD